MTKNAVILLFFWLLHDLSLGQVPRFRADLDCSVADLKSIKRAKDLFVGISGVEFVAEHNMWYFISDGKRAEGRRTFIVSVPGRRGDSLPDWDLLSVRAFQKLSYAESIRFDDQANKFYVITENDQEKSGGIRVIGWDNGLIQGTSFSYTVRDSGCSSNRGYEALSVTGKDTVWVIGEWPSPCTREYARLTGMRVLQDSCIPFTEFTYKIEKEGCLADCGEVTADGDNGNGISEMLAIDNNRFLILERCFCRHRNKTSVKLWEAQVTANTKNWLGISESEEITDAFSLNKTFLYDFGQLKEDFSPKNLEGMTWGPGRRTLIIVADDNESNLPSQFIILRIL